MSATDSTRRYQKRARARQEEETRRRITEAVVELHRTVGPAATKVTEVAERAGVSRMTVYNHFPTEAALIEACSTHWASQNPFPDPREWAGRSDPGARLRTALVELYEWYDGTADMLGNVLRDAPIVPALGDIMAERWWTYVDDMVDVLASGWDDATAAADRIAALRLAVDFRTWQVLTRAARPDGTDGLDSAHAADLAARMVVQGTVGQPA